MDRDLRRTDSRAERVLAVLADPRIMVAVAVAAAVVILWLARNLSFENDEWAFIVDRRLTVEQLLKPHNEHLVALLVVAYRGLVETIGIGSYLPYLIVLMACHVAAAAGLFVLLSRLVPPLAAIAATTLFLFLGSGYDNLLWAFQMGFVASVALGLWALVAADRPWVSAALLTWSIWTTSAGLFFILPVAILIRRRAWLALPIGSYVAWLVLVGRDSIPLPDVGPYLEYLLTGIGSAFAGLSGVGLGGRGGWTPVAGLIVAGVVAVSIGIAAVRGTAPSRYVLAGLAGLLVEYAALAIGRAQYGPLQAEESRYVYVAAPFIMLILTAMPRLPRIAWVAAFSFALFFNLVALPRGVATYEAYLVHDRSLPLEQRLAPFR